MNTTTKIILGIAALGTLGVGGYFLYKKFGTSSSTTADIQDTEYQEVKENIVNPSVSEVDTVEQQQEVVLPPTVGMVGESKTTMNLAEAQAKQQQFAAKGKIDIFGDLKSNYKSN